MTTDTDADTMPPAQQAANDAFWAAALESGVDCPRLARAMLKREVFPVSRAALKELANTFVLNDTIEELRKNGIELVTPEQIAMIREVISYAGANIRPEVISAGLRKLPDWARYRA